MYLLERDRELSILNSLLATATTNTTRFATVVGSGGTGKTELLGAFAGGLDDALVLTAAGSYVERSVEFGVVRQLFRSVDGLPNAPGGQSSDDFWSTLTDEFRATASSVYPSFDTGALGQLADVLTAESAFRDVVIVIDDVHEADQVSLQALAWLQRRFRFSRVVVVVSQPDCWNGHAELGCGLNVRRVVLGPLSSDAVQILAARRLGEDWAARHSAEVSRATGGNPTLVTALLDDQLIARPGVRPNDAVVLGETFSAAYIAAVRRAGPAAEAVVGRLAVLEGVGCPGDLDPGAPLLGSEDPSTTGHLADAVEALTRAGLLREGGLPHDAIRAVVLRSRPGHRRPAITGTDGEAGHLTWATAPEVAAAPRFRASSGSATPFRVARAAGGRSVVERASVGAGRVGDRAPLERMPVDRAGPEHELGTDLLTPWSDGVELALTVEPFALLGAAVRRHVDGMLARLDLPLREAADRRADAIEAGRIVVRAEAKRDEGDLAEAARLVGCALQALPAPRWGPLLAGPLSIGVAANAAMGRLDEADDLIRTVAVEAIPTGTHYGVRLLWSIGYYHLAGGRPDEALDTFFRCGRSMIDRGFDLQVLAPWRSGAAESQVMLGNHRAARALAVAQLEKSGPELPRPRGNALRVLAATMRPAERLPLLDESAVLLRSSGDRVGLARTMRELRFAHQVSGSSQQAREAASRSLELARNCGVQPLLDDVLLIEQIAGAKPVSVLDTLLSEAERRVAVLASQGQTNRQISSTLFVTVSTVEQHLTRIYRKLGVNGRAALGERVRDVLDARPDVA